MSGNGGKMGFDFGSRFPKPLCVYGLSFKLGGQGLTDILKLHVCLCGCHILVSCSEFIEYDCLFWHRFETAKPDVQGRQAYLCRNTY